jgi:hypothetical protein
VPLRKNLWEEMEPSSSEISWNVVLSNFSDVSVGPHASVFKVELDSEDNRSMENTVFWDVMERSF